MQTDGYGFFDLFFAPIGRFEPCGMFTPAHIISMFLCFTGIAGLTLHLSRFRAAEKKRACTLFITAVILTLMEFGKIAFKFATGETYLDAWVPLSYCSLFLYALWTCLYGGGAAKEAAEVFIAYACPVAGTLFLIFPTTSLMSYPIWHYLSLHSLVYHSLMVIIGLSFPAEKKHLDKRSYGAYISFLLIFSVIAVAMNFAFGCNLMNLREPYNIPIAFLQRIWQTVPWLYTALAFTGYLAIPGAVSAVMSLSQRHRR